MTARRMVTTFVMGALCLGLLACASRHERNAATLPHPMPSPIALSRPSARDTSRGALVATASLEPSAATGEFEAIAFVDDTHLVVQAEHAFLSIDLRAPKLEEHPFPSELVPFDDGRPNVSMSERGGRAILAVPKGAELWDLVTMRKLATLPFPKTESRSLDISRDGAFASTLGCSAPVAPAVRGKCHVDVFSGKTGQPVGSFPVRAEMGVEGAEVGVGNTLVSPDGRYVAVEKNWHNFSLFRAVYETATGKERVFDPDIVNMQSGARVLDFVAPDAVLLSRHDGAKKVDLVTGRTTAKLVVPLPGPSSAPTALMASHVRLPGSSRVAAVLGNGPTVYVWDGTDNRLVSTFRLANKVDPCSANCRLVPLDATRLSLVGTSRPVTLDSATGAIDIGAGEAAEEAAAVVDASTGALLGTVEHHASSCLLRTAARVVPLSATFCGDGSPSIAARGAFLVGHTAKGLAVFDLVRNTNVFETRQAPAAAGSGH